MDTKSISDNSTTDSSNSIYLATVVADVIITISYFAIPIEIWFFQRSLTRPLPFKFILVFFELFIFACGLTHLVGVFVPWFRSDSLLLAAKLLCAVVSFLTAAVMIYVIPKAFSLPVKNALLEEELGFRIRHEHSLQVANDLLIKFRKVTNNIRKSLNFNSICDTAVFELSHGLPFGGMAIFLPDMEDGSIYRCKSEFIKSFSRNEYGNFNGNLKTHYWKTITIDKDNETLARILSVTCSTYLGVFELSELVQRQRGILYKSGLVMPFHLAESKFKGFILAFNELENNLVNEEDVELFEDVVAQVEIALNQANQIKSQSLQDQSFLELSELNTQLKSKLNLMQSSAKRNFSLLEGIKTELEGFHTSFSNLLKTNRIEDSSQLSQLILKYWNGFFISSSDHFNLNQRLKLQVNFLKPFQLEHCIGTALEPIPSLLPHLSPDTHSTEQLIQVSIQEQVPHFILSDFEKLRILLFTLIQTSIHTNPTHSNPATHLNAKLLLQVSFDESLDQFQILDDPRTHSNSFSFQHEKSVPTDHLNGSNPSFGKVYIYIHLLNPNFGLRSETISKLIRGFMNFNQTRTSLPVGELVNLDGKLELNPNSSLLDDDLPFFWNNLAGLLKAFNGGITLTSTPNKATLISLKVQVNLPKYE